jgi:hypothetical protein
MTKVVKHIVEACLIHTELMKRTEDKVSKVAREAKQIRKYEKLRYGLNDSYKKFACMSSMTYI